DSGGGGALRPEIPQCPSAALRLDPMRGVEVMSLVEDLEREVGEDPARSLGHTTEVARIAPRLEREVDRLLERAQGGEIDGRRIEGVEERVYTGWALGHPRRRWAGRGRRKVDTVSDLNPHERGHPLRGRE